ncbi:class I SAM-dependent methyltransferase [Cylindrospermum sp. FACHB-282]|uniref:class I SAM-dependent methyltransferase n=1 Tax=Cylindrospermum sp. FACHB-282 TaxID=2692794 RepID=UPI00168A0DF6|nr:class I SAM-dependent methyltransferase [Cylindrospermum sp. FACHB-282]MBD2387048.1 class I SAM-dependent methyltransferase [Cylindrospermum sp. FACHB-282]
MHQQLKHAILPQTTHDELARQAFVNTLRTHIGSQINSKVYEIYEKQVAPRFKQEHERLPQDRFEVRAAMGDNLLYAWSSALKRTSQEVMWESVESSIERQIDDLVTKYQQLCHGDQVNPQPRLGSLTLDADFTIPKYQTMVDIHCMPGGYHTDRMANDITAGALYDRGVYLYVQGRLGPLNDGLGQALVHNYLKVQHSEWQPKRILDLGCTAGHSTLPYVDAYPDAEVYAIDIGASTLRYAHARAEDLGKRVHFSQQNAECTNFADGYFDLIVSHLLLHEIPGFAIRNVFQECDRLLAPGGLMAHLDAPLYKDMKPFQAFVSDWETANNNEPFWSAMRDLDLEASAIEAGFAADKVIPTFIPLFMPTAVQSQEKSSSQADKPVARSFGSRGSWYVFAAQK